MCQIKSITGGHQKSFTKAVIKDVDILISIILQLFSIKKVSFLLNQVSASIYYWYHQVFYTTLLLLVIWLQ